MSTAYQVFCLDGEVTLRRVTRDGDDLMLERILVDESKQVCDFGAPFNMGFAGPGPQQLSLAILLDALGSETPECLGDYSTAARAACRDFMHEYLSAISLHVDQDALEISRDDVVRWYRARSGAVCA